MFSEIQAIEMFLQEKDEADKLGITVSVEHMGSKITITPKTGRKYFVTTLDCLSSFLTGYSAAIEHGKSKGNDDGHGDSAQHKEAPKGEKPNL